MTDRLVALALVLLLVSAAQAKPSLENPQVDTKLQTNGKQLPDAGANLDQFPNQGGAGPVSSGGKHQAASPGGASPDAQGAPQPALGGSGDPSTTGSVGSRSNGVFMNGANGGLNGGAPPTDAGGNGSSSNTGGTGGGSQNGSASSGGQYGSPQAQAAIHAAETAAAAPAAAGMQVLSGLGNMLSGLGSGGNPPASSAAAPAAAGQAAPAPAPAPAAQDASRSDKVVAEIAGLSDGRTAAQRRADALLQEAQTRATVGKDLKGALEALDEAVRLDPGNIRALTRRSAVERLLGQYDKALDDAKRALALNPNDVEALNQQAWALFKLGRYQEALEAATRALQLDPNDAVAFAVRARARWALGDKSGALVDAQMAARLDGRFQSLADQMASGGYNGGDADLEESSSPRSRPSGLPLDPIALGLAALAVAASAGGFFVLASRSKRQKVRTFSSLARPSNGRLAGKYELRRLLGKGGMGSVHEAYDHSLKRSVAVKKMAEGLSEANPAARDLLIREAQSVASLRHPGVVDIYEIVQEGSDLYLVFELLDGKTLAQVLVESGPMDLGRAEELLRPVCQALEAAHAKDLVHRDLKPGNVMLTADGYVKLMDFGIARAMGEPSDAAAAAATRAEELPVLARTRMVMGTPAYMAPEMEYGVVCKEGDVYALGVTLYELLSRRHPFASSADKVELQYTPLSQLRADLPAGVDALLARALQPDPQRRLRTPGAFIAELSALARPAGTPPAAAARA